MYIFCPEFRFASPEATDIAPFQGAVFKDLSIQV